MSGFFAVMNFDGRPIGDLVLQRMSDEIRKRGPHSFQILDHKSVAIAHALCQTQDELPRNQPLTLDGNLWIVADARVDAQFELIRRLRDEGRDVQLGLSDAELILHAYHKWGEKCTEHLLGDFSFVIVDLEKRSLFAARDHLGMRPLFYAVVDNSVVISNAMNCVRLSPFVSCKLNDAFICDFLLFGWSTNAAATAFFDIHRLPAAHIANFKAGDVALRRYWTLVVPPENRRLRYDEQIEGFVDVCQTAIRDRLRSTRVGIFMSGGLDSTSVAAMTLPLLKEASREATLRAVCVVFDRIMPDVERRYATLAACHLGIPIDFVVADDLKLFDEEWAQQVSLYPEPTLRLPEYLAPVRRISEHQPRIVLSGEGGDEALNPVLEYFPKLLAEGRYSRWILDCFTYVVRLRSLPPVGLRTLLFRRPWQWLRGQKQMAPPFPDWIESEFVHRFSLREKWADYWRPITKVNSQIPRGVEAIESPAFPSYLDEHGLKLMFGGFQCVFPFFDRRVLNYGWSIPAVPLRVNKSILRIGLESRLPTSILERPKEGLRGCPIRSRFTDESPLPMGFLGRNKYVNPDLIRSTHFSDLNWFTAFETMRAVELDQWLIGQRIKES